MNGILVLEQFVFQMSSFALLQPHLMTTEQLRDHLKAVHLDAIQSIVFRKRTNIEIDRIQNYFAEVSKSKLIDNGTR